MEGRGFHITERTVRGKKSFYVQFINSENKRTSLLSVNKIASQLTGKTEFIKKKSTAIRACTSALERGIINTNKNGDTVEKYILEYWDYDGERVTRKNKLSPNSIGRAHCLYSLNYFKTHVLEFLPRKLLISDITNTHVRDVFNKVAGKNLANGTIAKIMNSFTTPLRQAYREGIILRDPTLNLESINTAGVERGILTQSEFKIMLEDLQQKATDHVILPVVLAAVTGMRLGEIRGLQINDIEIINDQDSIININKAWSEYDGLKTPKGKKSRKTVCPTKLARSLIELGQKNPSPTNDFIFWSLNKKTNTPISSSYIRDNYYNSLANAFEQINKCIGEMVKLENDEEIRKGELIRRERNVNFHSLRHFFITRAGSLMGGDANLLRLAVGHETQAMTDRYTHSDYDSLKKIADVSRVIYEEN